MNPVEFLRMKHTKTQADYATELGFKNPDEYYRHLRKFSQRLIKSTNDVYGVDLTQEIIAYLCSENKRLSRIVKSLSGTARKKNPNDSSNNSFDSIIDKIL